MPLQFINQGPSAGGRLGEALGGGLGQGFAQGLDKQLEQMASQRLEDLEQKRSYQGFLKAGYDPRTAQLFSMLRKNAGLAKLIQTHDPSQMQEFQESSQEPTRLSGLTMQPQELPRQISPQEQLRNQIQQSSPFDMMKMLRGEVIPQQEPTNSVQEPQVSEREQQQAQQELKRKQYESPRFKQKVNVKDLIAVQQHLKPILEEHRKDLNLANDLWTTSREALDLLEKHKDRFPGSLMKYLPDIAQSDPYVREYLTKLRRIVNLRSNSLKGNPTNYRTRNIELEKVSLDQPIETQENLLKSTMKLAEGVFDRDKEFLNIRSKNKGVYPLDLVDKISEAVGYASEKYTPNQAMKSGTKFSNINPENIPVGAKFRNPDTGKVETWNGKDFV